MELSLKDPARNDDVYKVAQRIFHNFNSPLNLHRDTKIKNQVRRSAFRRFIMGYPPRKKNDTSMGDGINWEWLIWVCSAQNANAIIVSRDGDYGVTYNGNSFINDWLSVEFSERVSRKKKLVLFDSLSTALKELNVRITKAEEDEERKMILRGEQSRRKKAISRLTEDEIGWLEILYGETWSKEAPTEELEDVFGHLDMGMDP